MARRFQMSLIKRILIAAAIVLPIGIVLVGQIWGLPDLEHERQRLQDSVPELELHLFEVLHGSDSGQQHLYEVVMENDRAKRRELEQWKESLDRRADAFRGKKIGYKHPGQHPDFTPTAEYKPILEGYERQREALRELNHETVEQKRRIARARGGKVTDEAVTALWKDREDVLSSITLLNDGLANYYSTPIGMLRKTLHVLSKVFILVALIALIIGFCAFVFGD